MKSTRHFLAIVLSAAAACTANARGLGSPAIEWQIEQWIKGDAIQLAAGKDKNVFVLVFWSTADPHSRATLPHMTEMQKKFEEQGVVLIAIARDDVETVKSYVADQADKIGFRVALDSADTTTRLYFQSVHNREMPHAFIINKTGVMVWHGHPMGGLEKTIAGVLDNTYDIETGRRMENARNLKTLYMQFACSPSKTNECDNLGQKIIEDGHDDYMLMNDFAWRIANDPGLIKRDLELALKAVQAAYEGTKGQNPDVLDTYARILFDSGKKEEALVQQREAVKLARDEESRQTLQKALDKYEAAVGED